MNWRATGRWANLGASNNRHDAREMGCVCYCSPKHRHRLLKFSPPHWPASCSLLQMAPRYEKGRTIQYSSTTGPTPFAFKPFKWHTLSHLLMGPQLLRLYHWSLLRTDLHIKDMAYSENILPTCVIKIVSGFWDSKVAWRRTCGLGRNLCCCYYGCYSHRRGGAPSLTNIFRYKCHYVASMDFSSIQRAGEVQYLY